MFRELKKSDFYFGYVCIERFCEILQWGGGILRFVEKIPVCLIPDKNKMLHLKIYVLL